MQTFLVVGLRNPGMTATRHNVAEAVLHHALAFFASAPSVPLAIPDTNTVVDLCVTNPDAQWQRSRACKADVVELAASCVPHASIEPLQPRPPHRQAGDAVRLVLSLPTVFMNDSGASVARLRKHYTPTSLCVVHDDMERRLGLCSPKPGGSANGHNGVKSVIQHLGTDQFHRLRVGIGRPPSRQDVTPYVLAPFAQDEEAVVHNTACPLTTQLMLTWLSSVLTVPAPPPPSP